MNKKSSSDQTLTPEVSSQKAGSPITQRFEGESPLVTVPFTVASIPFGCV